MFNINEIFLRQKNFFKINKYKVKKVVNKLKKFKLSLKRFSEELYDAVRKDFNRTKYETYFFELSHVYSELNYFIKNIRKISKNKKIYNSFSQMFSSRNYISNKPYGNVLIISSYEQPIITSLLPLIGSFASGNNTIIKLSPYSGNTNEIIKKIISVVFSSFEVFVINDKKENLNSLFELDFDFVFFSGEQNIAKIVYSNFSLKSIPTYINTSSKCPVIINDFKNIKKDIKKIVWGKLLNAGQSNLLPGYFLVNSKIYDEFVKCLIDEIKIQHPQDKVDFNLPCMISDKHYEKLVNFLSKQKIIYQWKNKPLLRKIYPTIIEVSSLNNDILHKNILGPIFPLIKYNSIHEIHKWMKLNKKPMAIYCFSRNKSIIDKIKFNYKSSFFVVNDIYVQTFKHLPFSTINYCSNGSFRFNDSYELFTYKKSVVYSKKTFKCLFPPYKKTSMLKVKSAIK